MTACLLLASAIAFTLKSPTGGIDLFVVASDGHYLLVAVVTVLRNKPSYRDSNSENVEG